MRRDKKSYEDELLDLETRLFVGQMKDGDLKRSKYVKNKIRSFQEEEWRDELHILNDQLDAGMHSKESVARIEILRRNLYFPS